MSKPVLVAYATKAGSTGEVAETIGRTLHEAGLEVEVRLAKDVRSLDDYSAVILGSAIRVGNILPDAQKFAERFQVALMQKPTAVFVVCATLWEDTPENRKTVAGYLNPLRALLAPVAEGLFAGKVDRTTLEQPLRFFFGFIKKPPMSGGDWRNWQAIGNWAKSLVPLLTAEEMRMV
jgi:menaquinone-dependent protoporphyrinogen oxidase